MNTLPLDLNEFANSVLAVPPLARRPDLSLDVQQNLRLISYMEAGGLRTLLYGGNANIYHCSMRDYAQLLELLASNTQATTRVIPAVGPDFGKMMDQARLLRDSHYKAAMVLPMQAFSTPEGVAEGMARFVDFTGIPVTVYLKSENTIGIDALGRLVDQGRVAAVKYAVVRDDPTQDPYLQRLVERVGVDRVVSGMGELPAMDHMLRFGLASFTSGSACIAPRASMRLLEALRRRDQAGAAALHARFEPLENLRESISLIRVMQDAVTLSGIADMGPQLPLLSASPAERMHEIKAEADTLVAFEQGC